MSRFARFAPIAAAVMLAVATLSAQTATPAPAPKPAPAAKTMAKSSTKTTTKAPAAAMLDINTATKEELMAFKGIGDKYSNKIIAGRPYAKKDQLVSKKILPEATYKKISGQIIAAQPK